MKKIFNKKFLYVLLFVFVILIIFISTNTKAIVPSITVTVTASPSSVSVGGRSWISWTSTGADNCNGDGPTADGYWTEYFDTPGTYEYTVVCAKADPVITCDAYTVDLVTCFTSDTKVVMADGTNKNIQDVKIGDVLKGETTDNKVLGLQLPKLNKRRLYSFNGGRYFVTAEHPLKTIDGWKSIDPKKTDEENIGITVTELKVGDTLITESGNVLLKTIDSKNDKVDTQLYNFNLDGDHTYYADGYLVHNKEACGGGFMCSSGSVCRTASGGSCLGTVAGSSGGSGQTTGPYEGYGCDYFISISSCEQGWLTHGCHWSTGGGTCASCPGSCPSGYTASCGGNYTLCTENTPCSGGTSSGYLGACVNISGNVLYESNGTCPAGGTYVPKAL